MKIYSKLIILLLMLLLAGCVSSKKYNAGMAEIDSLKNKYGALETEKTGLETAMSNLKEEVFLLQDKLNALEAERAALSSALEEKLKAVEAEMSSIKKAYEEATAKGKTLQEDNTNLRRLLEAKKDELTKEIVALKARLSEADAKNTGLIKEADGLKAGISEGEQKIKALKDELRSKQTEVSELKAEISNLSVEKATAIQERDKAIGELTKTYDNLVNELQTEIQKGEIAITQLRDKLSLSMVEKIMFDSGSAEIKKEGRDVLDRVGEILKKVSGKQIRVEGHTDNVPISPRLMKKIPTNWELSAQRATNVVRCLQENAGIDPGLLTAAGYAEFRPIASNDTEQGRAKNRRIEIVLIPLDIDRITEGH